MPLWYATREQVRRAAQINGASYDAIVDRLIEAASREIDALCSRKDGAFIPQTETRQFYWPAHIGTDGWRLWIAGSDLISVSTLQTKAQNSSPTTIPSTDYFLEPQAYGPPYDRIEIDLSSTSAFEAGDTPQRTISVAGKWGLHNETKAAGTLAEALDASETGVDISDASLIEVGHTILVDSEAMFVSDRATLDTTATVNGAHAADKSVVTIAVSNGTLIKKGEVVLIDSERMYVSDVVGNNLTVIRAYDGTVLATHANATAIYAYRTLTVERAACGTTAATHANAAVITKYQPPHDVSQLALAMAVASYAQEQAAYGRMVGSGEGQREFSGKRLAEMRKSVEYNYRPFRVGAV